MDDENVAQLGAGVHHSLSALAREFGLDRETLRKKLAAADVAPAGEHRGNPLWRLRDVYQAVISGPDSPIDPAALPPFQRKAHYQAKLEEIRYLEQCGQLMPVEQYREALTAMFKRLKLFLDTLPDHLERDAGLTPPQVKRVIDLTDTLRDQLADQIAADCDEDERKSES